MKIFLLIRYEFHMLQMSPRIMRSKQDSYILSVRSKHDISYLSYVFRYLLLQKHHIFPMFFDTYFYTSISTLFLHFTYLCFFYSYIAKEHLGPFFRLQVLSRKILEFKFLRIWAYIVHAFGMQEETKGKLEKILLPEETHDKEHNRSNLFLLLTSRNTTEANLTKYNGL